MKDNIGNLLLLLILSWIILFVGALLCGIGLFVSLARRGDRPDLRVQRCCVSQWLP